MYYLVLGIAIFSIAQIVNFNRKRKFISNKAGDVTLRNNIIKLSKTRSR